MYLGQVRGRAGRCRCRAISCRNWSASPANSKPFCADDSHYEELARKLFRATDFLYLGRGIHFPIALEGALKLKEISYIHAEGYPAGEMKHGPNALIDEKLPVVVLATQRPVEPRKHSPLRKDALEYPGSQSPRGAS